MMKMRDCNLRHIHQAPKHLCREAHAIPTNHLLTYSDEGSVQTFLPYPDYKQTAQALDYRRLGKQRVEAMQILRILLNETDRKGWRTHPAVLMWKGYETALAQYGKIICEEWIRRGYKDTLLPYFTERARGSISYPMWGDDFHRAHQSNLIRKDANYYIAKFGNEIPSTLEYIWTHQDASFV
jgi:Pyrimidine dimer DNA glycosylase